MFNCPIEAGRTVQKIKIQKKEQSSIQIACPASNHCIALHRPIKTPNTKQKIQNTKNKGIKNRGTQSQP